MGRAACLLVLFGACVEEPPIEVDRSAIDLPRGAGTDVVVTRHGAPLQVDELVWTIDNDAIATVARTSDGARIRISALIEGATTIHLGTHGQVVDVSTHVSPPAFVQLWIEPTTLTTASGTAVPVHATAIDTTNTIRDVSDVTGWRLMDPDVATVDNNMVHGLRPGHTVLQATLVGAATEVPLTVY